MSTPSKKYVEKKIYNVDSEKKVYNIDYYKQMANNIQYSKHDYFKLISIVYDAESSTILNRFTNNKNHNVVELNFTAIDDNPESMILIRTKINSVIFYVYEKAVYTINTSYLGEVSVREYNGVITTSVIVNYICDIDL